MKAILKRTTAVAALFALPLVPVAVHAEGQQAGQDQATQSELVPSDKEIDVYKSQKTDAPPPGPAAESQVTRESGEYVETESGAPADARQVEAGQEATPGPEGGEPAGVEPPRPDDAAAAQAGSGEADDTTEAETTEADQSGDSATEGAAADPGTATGDTAAEQQAGDDLGEDALIATVGDAEIRRSDVLGVISALPPQMQQQPPETLLPIALDQLVMRELILQEAREAGLDDDPEVQQASPDGTDQARENAMVQVWLDRELGKAVTDEAVQDTYDAALANLGGDVPPLEEVRPQIEDQLRQQAFLNLSNELQSGADVKLYGPDGQPITQ